MTPDLERDLVEEDVTLSGSHGLASSASCALSTDMHSGRALRVRATSPCYVRVKSSTLGETSSASGKFWEFSCEKACTSTCLDTTLYTTVLIQSLPSTYERSNLLVLLDDAGFRGQYTFAYLPINFHSHSGDAAMGYAIVDFDLPKVAARFLQHVDGKDGLAASWNNVQGVNDLIEHYRNRAIMHNSMREAIKPVLFDGDIQLPFPLPTIKLRKPRIRPSKATSSVPTSSNALQPLPLKLPLVDVDSASLCSTAESDRTSQCDSGPRTCSHSSLWSLTSIDPSDASNEGTRHSAIVHRQLPVGTHNVC